MRDLPCVIGTFDIEEKEDLFLPVVKEIFERAECGGTIAGEKVKVIHSTHGNDLQGGSSIPGTGSVSIRGSHRRGPNRKVK